MNRRLFLGSLAAAGAQRKPNIIVILADDLGSADAGFMGSKDIPTPNLDRLARSGVRFTQGYVSHPFCSPTRAGLMTGRYQQRFGHENNPRYDPRDEMSGLPASEITLPQALKDAGYATGHVGKWHLGAAPKHHPMKRGFKESFGFIGGGHDYFKAGDGSEKREYFIPIQRDGKTVVETEYLTDAFSREAEAFVRRHAKDPFFLYLAYNAPHTPLQATEPYLDRVASIADEKRRKYAAMTVAVDDGVGRLMNTLAELKLEDDTLVFFLSDNGGPSLVTNASNGILRGQKGQLYEGGIRVPFTMTWKGHVPAAVECGHPVISLDIAPTALAAAGVKPPLGVDGVNLLAHFPMNKKNETPPHGRLYWRAGGGAQFAVREDRYKWYWTPERGGELYDLQVDAGETNDLKDKMPDLAAHMEKLRADWNKELMPPVFSGPPATTPGRSNGPAPGR